MFVLKTCHNIRQTSNVCRLNRFAYILINSYKEYPELQQCTDEIKVFIWGVCCGFGGKALRDMCARKERSSEVSLRLQSFVVLFFQRMPHNPEPCKLIQAHGQASAFHQ